MDVLGPRGRIGILVPSFNTVVQPELEALRPAGVTNHVGRFAFDATLVDNVNAEAAKLLTAHVSTLIVGLSPDGIASGLPLLERAASDLEETHGCPVVTASHATHRALRKLGARRVGLVTPFSAADNEQASAAFAEAGFEVITDCALARPIDRIGETPLDDVRTAFDAVCSDGIDALVHVGTGLPVVGLVDELERKHGKPVVACNAAAYWQALRTIGVDEPIAGYGLLLERH